MRIAGSSFRAACAVGVTFGQFITGGGATTGSGGVEVSDHDFMAEQPPSIPDNATAVARPIELTDLREKTRENRCLDF